MASTTFRNASGLPHSSQLSSAKDMSILARALLRDFPEYYHFFSVDTFSFEGRTYSNHNKLLKTYAGADGFKTGYIRASGYNLVASATRDGRRLIGVVFGGRSSRHRNDKMAELLDEGFHALASRRNGPLMAKIEVPDTKPQPPLTQVASQTVSARAWAVQVGAFSRMTQARAAAEQAFQTAGRYLEGGQINIVPLRKGNGTVLHRARIEGISKGDAHNTCRILKDCLELKAVGANEVASR